MTERVEPPASCIPPNPGEDGYHWVIRFRSAPPLPLGWNATWHRNGGEGWGRWAQPDREHQWRYICPVTVPDEVAKAIEAADAAGERE